MIMKSLPTEGETHFDVKYPIFLQSLLKSKRSNASTPIDPSCVPNLS